jgi:hypothetical protein
VSRPSLAGARRAWPSGNAGRGTRWPRPTATLIAGRHPPEETTELVFGRPTGIESVVSFEDAG